MGETLGLMQIWEKKERERDRKERMKAIEEWNREKKQVCSYPKSFFLSSAGLEFNFYCSG